MPIPAAEATIRLGSEGGAETAREINRTAGAMTELGGAVGGMVGEFNRKPDVSGWTSVGKEMAFAAAEADRFSAGMVGLSKSTEQVILEMGGFGMFVEWIPGIGILAEWTRREEALAVHMAEKNKELTTSIQLLEEVERIMGSLSPLQRQKVEMDKQERDEVKEVARARLEQNIALLEERRRRQDLHLAGAEQRRGMAGGESLYRMITKRIKETEHALVNLKLQLKAVTAGHATADAQARKTIDTHNRVVDTLRGISAEYRRSAEALELIDPTKRYEVELRNIEQVRRQREIDAGKRIEDATNLTQAIALINETAANRAGLAWEKETQRIAAANKAAAAQIENDWKGAADAMGTHVKGFATALSGQIGSSSLDAAASFKNMADTMVSQLIRVAIQMAVMKFIPGAAPIASAAGFQHGGMVPAPVGQPQIIMAHGGERVVSDTGRGAPVGGEGGGTTNVYQFKTGVLTPDSQRTMIRQISRTQRGTGEKPFPR